MHSVSRLPIIKSHTAITYKNEINWVLPPHLRLGCISKKLQEFLKNKSLTAAQSSLEKIHCDLRQYLMVLVAFSLKSYIIRGWYGFDWMGSPVTGFDSQHVLCCMELTAAHMPEWRNWQTHRT